MQKSRVAVIGGAVAGLASMGPLVEEGHEVVAFEKSGDVVGTWATAYDSVMLLSAKSVTGFKNYPMPDDVPVYPSGEDYRRYVRDYAERSGLKDLIRFHTEVLRATPLDGGSAGWDLELSDGTTEHFDAVVVATGHLRTPVKPTVPGSFDGVQLHTSEYRNAADFADGPVVVVGTGNSGCDMVTDAIGAGHKAYMVIRTPTWFIPPSLWGRPRGDLPFLAQAPGTIGAQLQRFIMIAANGEPADYGFPQPSEIDWDWNPPTISTLIPYWAQRGRVVPKPTIERFDGNTVHFTDGTSVEAGTVIWATGYRTQLEFFEPGLLSWDKGQPARIIGSIASADLDNLYFTGFAAARGGAPKNYGRGAETLAKLVTARRGLSAPLKDTLFPGEVPEGKNDWLLAGWIAELERIEAVLKSAPATADELAAEFVRESESVVR